MGIIGRSKERLDAVKAEIEATVPGSEVACAVADASDAAAVKAAFADLAEKHGSPEVYSILFPYAMHIIFLTLFRDHAQEAHDSAATAQEGCLGV